MTWMEYFFQSVRERIMWIVQWKNRVTRISKKKKEEEEEPGAWVVTAIALVPAAVGNFRVIQARGPAVT